LCANSLGWSWEVELLSGSRARARNSHAQKWRKPGRREAALAADGC